MSASTRAVIEAAISIARSLGLITPSPAQKSIRNDASLSKAGECAEPVNPMHLGYQLCLKHTNHKAGDFAQGAC